MDYINIEDQIVAALNADTLLASKAMIQALPDRVSGLQTPDQFKSCIIVAFLDETPMSVQSINAVSMHYTATISVSTRALTRRGEIGVYAISELIKNCLNGLKLQENNVQLVLGKHSFAAFEDSIWEHEVLFNFRSLRVQAAHYPDGTDITNGEEVFYNPNNHKVDVNENIQVHRQGENCGCQPTDV